jgi:hypothetical protein
VYEWTGSLKLRVCSLHLTMIATRWINLLL